jgi:hypothetical protein
MDEFDPNKRADLNDQAAAAERGEAHSLYKTATNLGATADNLRTMGFGVVSDALDQTADLAANAAQKDMAESQLYGDVADQWRTVAHDLDGQAKATGESYVATAGQQTAEEYAGRATNDADRIRWEMKAAGLEVAATDLQHQASELGEDAQRAAEAALAAEAKLLGTDQ